MNLGEISVHQCKSNVYIFLFMTSACLQLVISSATIYGYSSLLVIFKNLGLYQDLCQDFIDITTNLSTTAATGGLNSSTSSPLLFVTSFAANNGSSSVTCQARDKALNLPFAFGMIFVSFVKIPLGNLIDTIGAKASQYIGW